MNADTSSHLRYSGYPNHHPGEELVAAYISGTLDEASALVIASHLTLCRACRHDAAIYEVMGGSMVEALPETPLAEDAFAATLARAKSTPMPTHIPATSSPLPRAHQVLPAPLRRYVGGDVEAATWRAIAPGIDHMPLIRDRGTTARLLRITPGKSLFSHSHSGAELTLILKGDYTSLGQRYARGDIEMADESVNHRPVAGVEGFCICLSVIDGPLRFSNWLGRLLQPFIGI